MTFTHKILFKLSSFLRCRVICGPNQEPYLERYHLLRLPFGIHIYLHRFVASDPGRSLHNHPWHSALSWVLTGQYDEIRLGNERKNYALQKRSIRAGHVNYISGKIYHRINLAHGQQVWTLFMHTASHRSWGFLNTAERKFCYTDHNKALNTDGNSLWWKTALRPSNKPDMRSSLDFAP